MKIKGFTLLGILSICLSTLIFLQYGCKKKSDDLSEIQQNIPVTTKVIDSTIWRDNFISLDTTNYTFTFNNALLNKVALKQGDVLVSAIGEGYLRKVDNVQKSGNNVIVSTSFANLSQALNNGSFSFTYILSAQRMQKPQYIRSGVTIDTSNLKTNKNSNLVFNIDTYIDNGQLIHLTGHFSLLPTIHCSTLWELLNLKYFHVDYEVQEQINLNASINLLNLQYNNEVELLNIPFEPIIVWIGAPGYGIPVVLTPKIEILAGTELNAQSALETSANQQLNYTIGITFEKNQWTPVNTFNNSFTYSPPSITASAEAKVYIKPKFTISVYGMVSPYLYGEGYSRIQADILATPWWSLYAGANVGLGIHMGIWGLIQDYTPPPFFQYETLLAAAGETVTDIDGNVYHTIKIGTQVWMVENLKTTRYNDGTAIPLVTDNAAWSNLSTPGYCWYNNDASTYKNTYGALYNWFTINTGKLAPPGWHVPSDADWTSLTTYLGGENVAGGKMKAIGTIESGTGLWYAPNTDATNESGFTAIPAGERFNIGSFYNISFNTDLWTSTEFSSEEGIIRNLVWSTAQVYTIERFKTEGNSVRCIKNN